MPAYHEIIHTTRTCDRLHLTWQTKRQELRPNKAMGNFERLLGWKDDPKRGITPAQVLPRKDATAAAMANQRLERLWGIIESEAGSSPANGLT